MKIIKLSCKDFIYGCMDYDRDIGMLYIRTLDGQYNLIFEKSYDNYFSLIHFSDRISCEIYGLTEGVFNLSEIELDTPCGLGNVIKIKIFKNTIASLKCKNDYIAILDDYIYLENKDSCLFISKSKKVYMVWNKDGEYDVVNEKFYPAKAIKEIQEKVKLI